MKVPLTQMVILLLVDGLMNFILMLTKNDLTIQNALEVFEEIKHTRIQHIGFKDIGLQMESMKILVDKMRKQKMETYMEVVSESEEANLESIKKALELGVDNLIGGTFVKQTLELLKEVTNRPRYYPYIGRIVGHPCFLRGTLAEIVADGRNNESLGIDGINLLAYRYDGDIEKLIISIRNAVKIPIIVAGSIDSFEKIRRLKEFGINGFTIGGAIIDKKFVPKGSLSDQVRSVINEISNAIQNP